MLDVAIVGAGHNGLIAAFYLARAGLAVGVFEAQETVGGACKTEELIPGYRFSTCANYAAWLRARVVEDMELFARGLEIGGGSPPSRILEGNRPFTWWNDPARLSAEIRCHARADVNGWDEWTAMWRRAAGLLGPHLLSYPPTPEQLLARASQIGCVELLRTLMTTSLGELADRFFESAALRSAITSPHDIGSVWDHGSALAMALATAVRSYSETGTSMPEGYVRGGMGRITEVMRQAAEEAGARVRCGSVVRQIQVEGTKVGGVTLESGEQVPAAVVLSNADPKRTFLTLVDRSAFNPRFLKRIHGLRTDIAPLKFHAAVSTLPEWSAFEGSQLPSLGPLTINPSRQHFEEAWDAARHGRLPTAPYMVAMTPSVWDDSLAPSGHHTVSFWILFAPVRLARGTWAERKGEMTERLLTFIDRYSPNFRTALVDCVLLTPWDLEQRVLLTDGNIHHVDIRPSQMLCQRPLPELAHYRTPIRGLYLCGAGQHPYGEVSGGPGHNAAHAVLEDLDYLASETWQQSSPARGAGAVIRSKAVGLP
jgi:phytoene dehydrogenase-like protein